MQGQEGADSAHHVAEVGAERPRGLVILHHTAVVEDLPAALTAMGSHRLRDWSSHWGQPPLSPQILLPAASAAPSPWHYLRVLSFFSRALACCSLMMVAFTWGGFMCTFSFPPTRSRTVAANLVCVFSTWGGCFSMMKVLGGQGDQGLADGAAPTRPPHQPSRAPTSTWSPGQR